MIETVCYVLSHKIDLLFRFVVVFTYSPQNEDELQLNEGDIVKVVEKCDDGWFVGISERTGEFGTFPGNYVKQL